MWLYSSHQIRYGGDDLSYRKAAEFLDDGPVEDWGCGAAYAKRFFKCHYTGIDGAPGFADKVADLRTYTSTTNGILVRHVLEHNLEWERILVNALASARKVALVIFTPFGNKTKQIAWNSGYEVPDISFRKEDLTRHFAAYREETFKSVTQYGQETVFYIYTRGGKEKRRQVPSSRRKKR